MRPRTRLVWIETPSNPLLKVLDIGALAEIAHRGKAVAVVDNTFASPYLQQPLRLGADLVLHSTTKYLGGHSDVIGGGLAGTDEDLRARIAFIQNAAGGVPGPFDAWLVLRGAKTLAVRMERHSANAQAIAEWLTENPKVTSVNYPGLVTHPQHALARRQMRAFGGMLSFELRGGEVAAKRMAARTKIFALAESLGGVESLIEIPLAMTHGSVRGTKLAPPAGGLSGCKRRARFSERSGSCRSREKARRSRSRTSSRRGCGVTVTRRRPLARSSTTASTRCACDGSWRSSFRRTRARGTWLPSAP